MEIIEFPIKSLYMCATQFIQAIKPLYFNRKPIEIYNPKLRHLYLIKVIYIKGNIECVYVSAQNNLIIKIPMCGLCGATETSALIPPKTFNMSFDIILINFLILLCKRPHHPFMLNHYHNIHVKYDLIMRNVNMISKYASICAV